MERIKVIILDNHIEERFSIEDILTNIEYISLSASPDTLEEAMSLIDAHNIDVILISRDFCNDGYGAASKIEAEFLDKAAIMIESELNEDTMYKAMQSGARDVILMPIKPSKLVDSISRVSQLSKKKAESHASKSANERKKSVGFGQVYTFFSTKGGTGKTFLALNLAIALQMKTDKKVALVDLNLESGNAALALDLQPKYTIGDIIDDIKNLAPEYLETFMTKHPSGLKVLSASHEQHSSEFISAEHIQTILKSLQSAYDYIIIDMPSRFYEPINPAFVFSEKLYVVTTPEILSVRNTKGAIVTLTDFNYPKSKIKVVVNKHMKAGEIKTADIEKTLGYDVSYTVADDYLKAISSMNQGFPYVVKHPKSDTAKNIHMMVRDILASAKP